MRKPRKDYAYIAHRIDPDNSQNLGDFAIVRWVNGKPQEEYHYGSEQAPRREGRVTNRGTLRFQAPYGQIYQECIRAVERLLKEENNA